MILKNYNSVPAEEYINKNCILVRMEYGHFHWTLYVIEPTGFIFKKVYGSTEREQATKDFETLKDYYLN